MGLVRTRSEAAEPCRSADQGIPASFEVGRLAVSTEYEAFAHDLEAEPDQTEVPDGLSKDGRFPKFSKATVKDQRLERVVI